VKIDDEIVTRVINTNHQSFENVQIVAGYDLQDPPANALIRNLEYSSKGKKNQT